MKRIYIFFHHFTFFTLAISIAFIFLLTQNYIVAALAQKYLKETGIEYSRIEGTLLQGIILSDFKYTDAISIKKLQINYNLLYFLRPTLTISKIKADGLYLDVSKLPSFDDNSSQTSFMSFAVSNIELKNTKIIVENETLEFDLKAKGFHYHKSIDVDKLSLDFKSSYANALVQGNITSNKFRGDSSVQISESIANKYLSFFTPIPKTLNLKIEATTQKILLSTNLENLIFRDDENLSINDANINLAYSIKDNNFEVNAKYTAAYLSFEAVINQMLFFTTDEKYESKISATITKQPIELPFKIINADIFGDSGNIKVNAKAGSLDFNITSNDYEYFSIHANNEYFKADGDFELHKDYGLYKAVLYPKLKNEFYKNYPVELFSPIKIVYKNNPQDDNIILDANLLHVTLSKKDSKVKGFGTFASSEFTVAGEISTDTKIDIVTKIPSIKKLLSQLQLSSKDDKIVYDAKAKISSVINLGTDFSVKNDIYMPWFTVTMDSEKTYLIEDISLSTKYTNKIITIDAYDARYMEKKFHSKKPSTIVIDKNENIVIKEFWLYDNLLVTGFVDTAKNEANAHIRSDRFNYQDKDSNVTIKTDLRASIDALGKQKVEGSITLLDGVITHVLPKDYVITDEDIIVIQDIKAKSNDLNRLINVSINSLHPITYKTKNIHINFTPDIIVYQELNTQLKLLGMITINEGEISNEDKEFIFDKSEIYFTGENPVNPQLNLNLHYYTLDYVDIEIFITNTLSSPVIIFSSKPAMSQNDIMSYILFGEPASSLFESSDGTKKASVNSLLLGTGLKQIFSDTAGVKLDTLNILTNKEGTLGYEIGTRFNKNIRIVYKNNTASSVILQYSLSKSIRIDVDVAQTGQGVNIIYVKDF